MTYKGECFCGAVHIEVSGEPEGMGYCHCRSCRSWSGGPVNAFTLWEPGAVRVTAGAVQVSRTPRCWALPTRARSASEKRQGTKSR
jgi:hypothetical protein